MNKTNVLCALWLFTTAIVYASPIISIDRKEVDFGIFPANLCKEHIFKITNTGSSILKIVRVRTTCDCFKIKLAEKELLPGKSTSMTVALKPESEAGKFSKKVMLQSNDPRQRFLIISFKGNAQTLVSITPENKIFLGDIQPGTTWKQIFMLKTSRSDVILGKPQVPNKAIKLNLKTTETHEYQLLVELAVPQKAGVRFEYSIKIPVSSPKGWKPMEIIIKGKTMTKKCAFALN